MDDVWVALIAVPVRTAADVRTALMAGAAEYVRHIHHLLDIPHHAMSAGIEIKLLLRIL